MDDFTWVRISLVMDTQQIADTAPGYSDIYDGINIRDGVNDNTKNRFRILWSKAILLHPNITGVSVARKVYKYKRFNKPIVVRYNGANATDIQRNGLYLCLLSNQGTYSPTPNMTANVYFVDV